MPDRPHSGLRQASSRAAAAPSRLATIQRAAGNLAIQRKCACGGSGGDCTACAEEKRLGLQTKLAVNAPGDVYEQEADRFAEQVTAGSAPARVEGSPRRLEHAPPGGTAPASDAASVVDQALSGAGHPLEPDLRLDMEQRFGQDFSGVRLHTDATAAESARAVGARAYTVGGDIVFDRGHFAPETSTGKRLLAHELAHVVQQSGAGGAGPATHLQRDSTDDLADFISRDLDSHLATNPSDYAYILDAFHKISSDVEDNVAAAFVKLQSPETLERFAASVQGRAVLDVLTEAMITGSVTRFETEQAEKILIARRQWLTTDEYVTQADRIAGLRHKAQLIFSQDEAIRQMARDLHVYVANDLYARVTEAIDALPSKIEDNVSAALTEMQSDVRLSQIAVSEAGRRMLDVLYEAMITGDVSSFESLQCERILIAKAHEKSTEEFANEAERIGKLRDKAEDSPQERLVDRIALATARMLNDAASGRRYAEVSKTIRDASARIEDNVASHFVELQSPARLLEFAADAEGRAMLDILYEAIITGDVTDFERLQANRIIGAKATQKPSLSPGDYVKKLEGEPAYVLPLRMQKTFRTSYAIFKARLQPNGKIKVNYDDQIHFWSADMFEEDRKGLPYSQWRDGKELDPDHMVWLKLYDQNKALLQVPALALIDYANQAMRNSVTVGVSAFEMGLFLGYGGLAAFSGEGVGALAARVEAGAASQTSLTLARTVLWADRAAMVLPILSTVANENRDWILEKFPNAGPALLGALDQANRFAGYYGWGRLGFDGARYLKSKFEPTLAAWRAEKASAKELTSSQRRTIESVDAQLETLQRDLATAEKEAANDAVKRVESKDPTVVESGKPGERRAQVDNHEVVQVKDPNTGAIHCEFHSSGGPEVDCPVPWLRDGSKAEPTPQAEAPRKVDEPAPPPAVAGPAVAASENAPRLAQVRQEIAQNDAAIQELGRRRAAAQEKWKNATAAAPNATGTRRQRLLDEATESRNAAEQLKNDAEKLRWRNNALKDEERLLAPPPPKPTTWPEAEEALRKEFGGQKTRISTAGRGGPDLGIREIDSLGADNISREAKFGLQSYGEHIQLEIEKDIALMKAKRVKATEWHFYENPQTGVGPTPRLKSALDDAGIKVVIHK